jgi:alkylated DNA repair dioxygenase AlkB
MIAAQRSLFEPLPVKLPEGFRYVPAFLSIGEEQALVKSLEPLPFKEFEFRGYRGKRCVVSYGWRYDFNGGGLTKTADIPAFLLPMREKAAHLAGKPASELQQVLLTKYPTGAQIGWHKDKAVFDEVVGISLSSSCILRFRRRSGARWDRASLVAESRSAYLLHGPARTEWEHSIPAVSSLRYSITFRNLRSA